MPNQQAEAVLSRWLEASGVEWEAGRRAGEYVVQLPGEAKLRTVASILVGGHALSATAFVVRRPDENHQDFYALLLRRNLRLPGVAFALDALGDVFLVGRLPAPAVTAETIDALLGALLSTADGAFNELLAMGFLSSMQREWHWRMKRGESTANLAAFRNLLDDGARDDEPHGSPPSPGD